MEERARVTEADWEDFWYAPEKFGTWHPEDTKNGDDIVVNMDGGVGGSWREISLPENSQEPFIPDFHD